MKAMAMTETDSDHSHSRVVRLLSGTSFAILCLTAVLVASQFLPVDQTPESTGWWWAINGSLAWFFLPPIGLLLAIPGLRRPRSRWAVLGFTGHALLLVGLWVFMTFFFSFA